MKILIAPLNWGLGHASRCVPLIQRYMDEGHEVIIGGDGDSLVLLRKHFPTLRYTYLAPLQLRYSAGRSQVWAMVLSLPKLISWAIKDHAMLQAILREEEIESVVSDNRFGLYSGAAECIYITHQLHIMLPKGWRWLEPLAARLHARIYAHYNKVWVPDYAEESDSLGGELSHPRELRVGERLEKVEYIGPLSRFKGIHSEADTRYDVVAVLSGLEPHRSMLEQEIISRYQGKAEQVLIVQGLMGRPNTRIKRGNITMLPYMADKQLVPLLMGAKHVISRSGFSSIMDFASLGILEKAEFIPTPGQPEQEYLSAYFGVKMQKNVK